MSQDNNKPGQDAPEVNGVPVDLGSHNLDPDAHNWLRPEEDLGTWEHAFEATEQRASEDGASEDPAAPEPDPEPEYLLPATQPKDIDNRQRLIIGSIIAGFTVLMAVGIWLLVNTLSSGTEPSAAEPAPITSEQSTGPLPREVQALEFQLGDCFADFDSEAAKATAVACDTAHSAQLVAVHRYGADEGYPGREALKTSAQEACKGAKLNAKSNEHTLKFQFVYPSSTSWDKGDRRVDCFVVVDTGNTIMDDLLQR